MKTIKQLMCLLLIIAIISCDNDNDPTNNVCDENYVSNLITTAYSITNGYDDLPEWMDLETHEYTLQINANGEICSIGYQNPSTYTGGYTMEVTNLTTNVSYSGTHTFLQTGLDYQTITPIQVTTGDQILVKRTILPGYVLLNETIGRVFRKTGGGNVPYPITEGTITFLSSNFYGSGGPIPNFLQPYIALGFKVD